MSWRIIIPLLYAVSCIVITYHEATNGVGILRAIVDGLIYGAPTAFLLSCVISWIWGLGYLVYLIYDWKLNGRTP